MTDPVWFACSAARLHENGGPPGGVRAIAIVLEAVPNVQALPWLRSERVLLVLGVRMALGSSSSIRALARERSRQLLSPIHVVLTYEFGTLTTVSAPDLSPCHLDATLEKPFDLQTLQGVATAFFHASGEGADTHQARGAGP